MHTLELLRECYEVEQMMQVFDLTEEQVLACMQSEPTSTDNQLRHIERLKVQETLKHNPRPMVEKLVIEFVLNAKKRAGDAFDIELMNIIVRTLGPLRYKRVPIPAA